jgi:hypothetical protein
MKHKFYLLLLIFPSLISFGLYNQSTLKQNSILSSNSESSSFNLVRTWQINTPAFFDSNRETYTLKLNYGFGHFVEFKQDNTFKGYYRASCGNDCFTQTEGSYTLNNDILEIFVASAEQTGFCLNPISFKNKKIGSFKIINKTKDNFSLKKI